MDFAYKYPFSNEAKQIISEQKINLNNIKYLDIGKARVKEAIENKEISYENLSSDELKLDFVISYVFARIIISALKDNYLLNNYVIAEAKRCIQAMRVEEDNNLFNIVKQLKSNIKQKNINNENLFCLPFTDLLINNKENKLDLANLKLNNGFVYLNKYDLLTFFIELIKQAIKKNLPISLSKIPKQVFETAKDIKKDIKVEVKQYDTKISHQYLWIEKLINTPISDVRHRSVNLIFAPYFVNIRNFDEQKAFEIISQYIEKCKQLESNTKINNTYILYQCKYAKSKNLKPLSFENAKELLEGILNLDDLVD